MAAAADPPDFIPRKDGCGPLELVREASEDLQSALGFVVTGLCRARVPPVLRGAVMAVAGIALFVEFPAHGAMLYWAPSRETEASGRFFDEGQSGSIIVGENFGIVTDIQTAPDGSLFVTSLSNGAIYRITRNAITVPTPGTPGPVTLTGTAGDDKFVIRLKPGDPTVLQVSVNGGTAQVTGGSGDLAIKTVTISGGGTLTFAGSVNFWWHMRNTGASINVDGGTSGVA